MKIEESILLTRDLDIFFGHEIDGEVRPVHCATFGGLLPEELNDEDYIYGCLYEVISTPDMFFTEDEIFIEKYNVDYILGANTPEGLLTIDERKNAYIRTFVNMARKGFWSYDRYHSPHSEPEPEDNRYLLIARPKTPKDQQLALKEYRPWLIQCNHITLIDDYKAITK